MEHQRKAEERAALKIQTYFRGDQARKKVAVHRTTVTALREARLRLSLAKAQQQQQQGSEEQAALKIQCEHAPPETINQQNEKRKAEERAALTIQKTFRAARACKDVAAIRAQKLNKDEHESRQRKALQNTEDTDSPRFAHQRSEQRSPRNVIEPSNEKRYSYYKSVHNQSPSFTTCSGKGRKAPEERHRPGDEACVGGGCVVQ